MIARGWKPCLGWLVRARTRGQGGNETKRKFPTYEAAVREAISLHGVREVWVEEIEIVARRWADLEPKRRPFTNDDRAHFLNVEAD